MDPMQLIAHTVAMGHRAGPRSATPGAPVVPERTRTPAPSRLRARMASALRLAAERLDPQAHT